MDRKEFLTTSAILSGAAILPSNSVFAENINNNGIDKLTDGKGNFIHLPLPYNADHLEPFMDTETLRLHHTFHHGGAVKGANKDLEMIKKVMKSNDLTLTDYWTKKLSFHLSSHILHSIFWTNLANKKSQPTGELLKRIEKDFIREELSEKTQSRFFELWKECDNRKNDEVSNRRKGQKFWLSLGGIEFEDELGKVFQSNGYKVKMTSTVGDGGIDLYLTDKGGKEIIVQCKAHKKPVGVGAIRDLLGTLYNTDADQAILASVSGFTEGVYDFAAGQPIKLLALISAPFCKSNSMDSTLPPAAALCKGVQPSSVFLISTVVPFSKSNSIIVVYPYWAVP